MKYEVLWRVRLCIKSKNKKPYQPRSHQKPWTNDSKKLWIIWFCFFLFYEFFVFVFFSPFSFQFVCIEFIRCRCCKFIIYVSAFVFELCCFINFNAWRYKVRTKDIIIHRIRFCFWRPSKGFLFCWFFIVSLWIRSLPLSFYIFFLFFFFYSAHFL